MSRPELYEFSLAIGSLLTSTPRTRTALLAVSCVRLVSMCMSVRQVDDAVPTDSAATTEAASRLLNRGISAGDAERVRRAVALFESVLAASRPNTSNHVGASANVSGALIAEFEMTGRVEALERAASLLDAAESDSKLLGNREADFFSVLGHALLRDAERTAVPATVERGVAARRRALELTRREDEAYPGRLTDLGAVLAVQFRITGSLPALDEAVKLYEAAVRRSKPGAAGRPRLLSNFGTCLDELAVRSGDAGTLQRAVAVQRDALTAVSTVDPLGPMIRSNLGISLLHLYEETGTRAVLDEAITLDREAVSQTPSEYVEYYPRQTNLAVALQCLYERTGDLKALDEAIEIFRQAVDSTPASHANRFRYLHDLASALMRLAERTGDLFRSR